MPRVVSGRYGGIPLQAPEGRNTRPTTDKVKEALFSIIQTQVPGANFLDLFAGSGQIGIEAASRGAEHVTMVEQSGAACRIISKNLEKLRLEESPDIMLIRGKAQTALEALGENGEKFDIIFMDPPYAECEAATKNVCEQIVKHSLLAPGGTLISEHSSDLPFATDKMALKACRSCSYGLTVLTFFVYE